MTAAVALERSGCEIISGALSKLIVGKLGAFWGTLEKRDERDKLVTCMLIVLHGSVDPMRNLFNCTSKQIESLISLFWLSQSVIQRLRAYPISKPAPNA